MRGRASTAIIMWCVSFTRRRTDVNKDHVAKGRREGFGVDIVGSGGYRTLGLHHILHSSLLFMFFFLYFLICVYIFLFLLYMYYLWKLVYIFDVFFSFCSVNIFIGSNSCSFCS